MYDITSVLQHPEMPALNTTIVSWSSGTPKGFLHGPGARPQMTNGKVGGGALTN